jgi:nicotinamidase-related amidase
MTFLLCLTALAQGPRVYENKLTPIRDPAPLLADHPEFVEPIRETARFEAPLLVDDPDADLQVRAWRFSYNARAIIEIPNRLAAARTAVVTVHPWGIDDGQGWQSPEPAGAAFFCTPEKNRLGARHAKQVVDPFLKSMRGRGALIVYSLPGRPDPIRAKLYRSFTRAPDAAERARGAEELRAKLTGFRYRGEPIPAALTLSPESPVADYFRQFPGLDPGPRFNAEGFWDLPIPVTRAIDVAPDDVVAYDAEGYEPLKAFLKKHGVRHVLLTGYNTDMCYRSTTAGYDNLSRDFDVFLVGDATLATYPSSPTPRFATQAAIAFAAIDHLVTQVSWVRPAR